MPQPERGYTFAGSCQQLLWQILDVVPETHGVVPAFWIVVITAPVLEDAVRRRACLGYLARRFGGSAGPIAFHLVFDLILALFFLL